MRAEHGKIMPGAKIYAAFTGLARFAHRNFMPPGADEQPERMFAMGDLISIFAGGCIFALLIFYVPACEAV